MNENIKDIYPLSPMQQGMLFHSLYAPETEVYTEQMACRFVGELNIDAFRQAWERVLQRHDILRSAFVWEDLDEPLQVVHEQVDLPFEILDWSEKSSAQQKGDFEQLIKSERQAGLELTDAPLMRIKLIRLKNNEHYFLWSYHHLLFDGWGFAIILGEIFRLYEGLSQNKDVALPPVRPFRDYIAWLQAQDMQKAENFWKKNLAGFTAPTPLPVAKNNLPTEEPYLKERHVFGERISQMAHNFSRDHQITINTIFQGALSLLLSRYSGEKDVLFGSTVSGRPTDLPGSEGMVGLFINTLPIRVQIDGSKNIKQWLQELQLRNVELREYEYTPLVKIHGWSEVPRSQPLFETLLVFENYPVNETISQSKTSLQIKDVYSFEKTNYPLTFVTAPGKQLVLDIAYDATKFDRDTIRRMQRHFENIVAFLVEHPEQSTALIDLTFPEEKKLLLTDWNGPEKPFPQDKTIHELFEEQASKTPQAVAVDHRDQTLTFEQLNQQANQLAHHLRALGVSVETMVGISLPRSLETVVASLAVLKAGGAYLPIDPEYPEERIQYMIADSGIRFLITADDLAKRFAQNDLQIIKLWEDRQAIESRPVDNPQNINHPENLAFIIYTSGSTGKPKGVLLQHRGAVNFVQNMAQDFGLQAGKTMLQLASFSFDAATSEIFSPLLAGAKVQMIDKDVLLASERLVAFIRDKQVTTATFPPSLLTLLPEDELKMETVISVGDACPWELAARFSGKTRFVNGYGPTEGTIGAIWGEVDSALREQTTTAPIGRPNANVKIYLLDADLNLVPQGVPGEIHIGGAGVARGYHNRPDLTAEKFIPDPFSKIPGARMYKTGDLARWLPDGQIEFIGRVDFQVKIRGFRIELGEIEAEILQRPEVKDAVVIARGQKAGEKSLAAYLIPQEGQTIDPQAVRDALKERLPGYMVPAAFVVMDAFPLSPNGKVDRKALPDPEQADMVSDEYVAPRTPEEELLASIWADLLNLEKVSVISDFFDLGGHSLLATQLVSRIRDAFEIDLPLKDIFEASTIEQLARLIDRQRKADQSHKAPPITRVDRSQRLPLSFAQQRLWFLDQLQPGGSFYNIPGAVRLTGELNVPALEQSLTEMVRRHESLRTTFDSEHGKPFMVIHEPQPVQLPLTDLSAKPQNEREAELKKITQEENRLPFDLKQGPLFRARLIRMSENDHVVLFTMHHIISDGWSMGIFMQEIAKLYRSFVLGEQPDLPELDIQYADYAAWQQSWLQGEVLEKELDFWRETIGMNPPVLELPFDHPRPAVQTFNGKNLSIRLNPETSAALKKLSQKEGATPFMTLLAAFQTLLHRYSGQEEILVGSPIANRNRSETEKLIGFFVNNIVLKSDFYDDPEFSDLLRRVRENTLNAYAHQDVPFEQVVDALQTERSLSHSPIFQVMFVMQNLPQSFFELPGLTMRSAEEESGSAKFDLSLIVNEAPDHFSFNFEFNTDLFEEDTIRRMQQHFVTLLEGIVADPEQKVCALPIIPAEEERKITVEWNQTAAEFDADLCAHEKFQQMVQAHAQTTAVSFNGQSWTYAQLNERVNQLARHLREKGVAPDHIVGICMERSFEMVAGIMAVLKAGGAFLPLDPAYPAERLSYMAQDSGTRIILTQQNLTDALPFEKEKLLAVDSLWSEIAGLDSDDLPSVTTPDNLGYVIYTSGSTGKPKGTMLPHRGMVNLANEQRKAFNISAQSRILQFSSLSFDASVWETVMALLNGAALVLVNREILASGEELVNKMAQEKVTTVTLPPSVLAVFPKTELPHLQTIITAGEKCTTELVKNWAPGRKFFNAYGPTETTVCASMYLTDPEEEQAPPIGRPIGNFQLYILDRHWRPVPIGVPGELCVGGVGLARGYLNRPDLTAEKFIPNPFSDRGERLYRTGDLVRYKPDGNIEFLGRIDYQVKVRGFRIELGEIEANLNEYPGVRDVAVLAREDQPGQKQLVAYLVADEENKPSPAELRDHLKERLPDYMIPAAYVFLDAMPLTPNGKVDRRRLPAPDMEAAVLRREYVAPRNETEEKLTAIVAQLLNLEKVGVYDNFFELGGHSLLATQFISRVKEEFEVELPLITLFEKPTIEQMALAVQEAKLVSKAPAKPQIKRIARDSRRVRRSDLQQRSGKKPDNNEPQGKPGE